MTAGMHFSLFSGARLPMLQQSEATECGLACLGMVAAYYGSHWNLVELRQRFSVSLAGTTLADLLQFAEQLQLSGRALRIELEQLAQLQKPAILHWDLNHFVVLKSVRRGWCEIHDPAVGVRRLSLAEVSEHFTGVALELTPLQDFKARAASGRIGFRDFWSRLVGFKRSLALLLTLSLLVQLFSMAAPYYIQLVVDDVLVSSDRQLLQVLLLGFGLVLGLEVLSQALRGWMLVQFGNTLNLQMATNLFHHLLRLPLSYFEKRHIGDVLSRFTSLQQVRDLLTSGMLEALIDGLMGVLLLGLLALYSLPLMLLVLGFAALYVLLRLALYPAYRRISEQQLVLQAREHSYQIETVRAMQTLKLFGGEARREAQWQHLYVDTLNQGIRLGLFQLSYQSAQRLLAGLEYLLVIYFGAQAVLQGGFSTGMLFAFLAYRGQFVERAHRLIDKYLQFRMLSLHFERLSDVVLTTKEQTAGKQLSPAPLTGELSVRQVSFRYSELAPAVLQDVSLQIRAGESVALVGPSGCGKTTLMKLMLGLLEPSSGEVRVDGQLLREYGLSAYRSQIGAVMQDDQLLSGSIRDNICGFAEQVDQAWLQQCAQAACIAHDIEQLPMGYHSLIGDMGSSLSGGQKQRLLLARALYRKPRILFLDEATSHLDSATEQAVNQAIRQLAITRIVIAHRPETIASVERVVTLPALQLQPAVTSGG